MPLDPKDRWLATLSIGSGLTPFLFHVFLKFHEQIKAQFINRGYRIFKISL